MVSLIGRGQKLATQALADMPRRLAHVGGVAAAAQRVVEQRGVKYADQIVAAAWLHDIGYAPSIKDTGFHPVDGARFVQDAGFPELVVSLVAFHTGARIEAEERGLSADLAAFTEPGQEPLDVLIFSDMTTSPDGAPIAAPERIAEILARYPEADPVHRAVSRSAPDLLDSVSRVEALLTAVQPR